MTTLLIIFAKKPTPGQVKSRLAPTVAPEGAARLAEAFLRDVLEQTPIRPGFALAVAYGPKSAQAYFRDLAPAGTRLFPQEGADLGERMANAFDFSFAAGYGPVLLRGSDTPDLPASIIYEAQEALAREKADLVLGPAADGGYYLIGLSQPAPRLFEDIAWSTPGVLDATLQLATGMGLTVHLLPGWRDIDTPEDLLAFLQRSRMAPAPGWRSRAAAAELLGLAYTDNSPNILK